MVIGAALEELALLFVAVTTELPTAATSSMGR